MSGNQIGGLKTAQKLKARDPDYYKRIGQQGGLNGVGADYQKGGISAVGFAANPELARIAGAKGGRISRRKKVTTPDEEITEAHISFISKLFPWIRK